jgi:hypothetical protein
MGDNNKEKEKNRLLYHIKNGDRRAFNPGFSSGSIALIEVNGVRVVGINRDNGLEREIPVVSVDSDDSIDPDHSVQLKDIYPHSLHMIPLSELTGYFTIGNFDHSGKKVHEIHYRTISCPIYLDCDADRDGIVGYNEEGKANWSWGPEGRGAVLLVNNDKDKSGESPHSPGAEYSVLLVRSTGYKKVNNDKNKTGASPHFPGAKHFELPGYIQDAWDDLGLELRLFTSPKAATRFAVYRVKKEEKAGGKKPGKEELEFVLGARHGKNGGPPKYISDPLNPEGERLLVEAHQYPGQYSERYWNCLKKGCKQCMEEKKKISLDEDCQKEKNEALKKCLKEKNKISLKECQEENKEISLEECLKEKKMKSLEECSKKNKEISLEECLKEKQDKCMETCMMECRKQYPDSYFEGLISIELHLRKVEKGIHNGILLASDRVVFRVAPWIMTPNTLPVKEVYVSNIPESENEENTNKKFVAALQKECDRLNVHLDTVDEDHTGRDPYLQDQIEFGYSQGIKHHLPVVFNSPRREIKGLYKFAKKKLLDNNFGLFELGGSSDNELDSFGNLEVSPPVTVNGKHYPLGRIIFGGRYYVNLLNPEQESREIMPKLRRFLYAQKVQSPIEVFTDWLEVGHVDEIICFIPNTSPTPPGEKEFKVLLASPASAYTLLETLKRFHGENEVFYKKKDREGKSAQTTVNRILEIEDLLEGTMVYQEYMNLNRAILAKRLDLQHNDFIDIPVLFEVEKENNRLKRTKAYFPNMINHLVIGHTSIVPKPYGPKTNDQYDCAFEEAFCKAMPKGHEVRFIDAWDPYHTQRAAIHCGTNTLREQPTDIKWWHTLPDEGFDI